ncbi:HAD family phosphatase [Oscillatoria amoena NRMC-F 0135]|nr:HAD family phosphatase [Oscillatoria laete-virens]MDL5048694.1 HAD family phosphatase [Oscillatoria amoena NRMC-F 0135]MDL5053213.1 HAD family phosphatase [Oscillatoria laete-virens NRMC-F 0139]
MTIDALFFDLGKVLLNFDFGIAKRKISQKSSLTPAKIEKRFFSNPAFTLYEKGTITTVEFFQSMADWLDYNGSLDELAEIFCEIFWEHETNIEIANRLSKKMPVYLVSNTCEAHIQYFEPKHTFLREFKFLYYSNRIRHRKPEPGFYAHVIKHSGENPRRSIFIDDLEPNILGAKKAGFKTILLTPETNLRRELARFGVKV